MSIQQAVWTTTFYVSWTFSKQGRVLGPFLCTSSTGGVESKGYNYRLLRRAPGFHFVDNGPSGPSYPLPSFLCLWRNVCCQCLYTQCRVAKSNTRGGAHNFAFIAQTVPAAHVGVFRPEEYHSATLEDSPGLFEGGGEGGCAK